MSEWVQDTSDGQVLSKQKLLIIGGGMAGAKLAAEVMLTLADSYHVTLIGEERQVGYNRILLSSLLAQEVAESELALVDVPNMIENGAKVLANDPVVHVCSDTKTVVLKSGVRLAYDKLVFATGSRSHRLPIDGVDLSNVIGFRDFNDVASMAELPKASRVVVVGGGLLGLEAAVGLIKRGHHVTLVHRADYLLNRQLDKTAAQLLLDRMQGMGIEFTLGHGPAAFLKAEEIHTEAPVASLKARAIELTSGDIVEADLFVMATGIVPEISLAQAAGVQVNRAIVVNEYMETSVKDVFAIGECTEFQSNTFGLVAPIWDQLHSLMARLADKKTAFAIEPVPTKLKVSGVNVFSVGEINPADEQQSIRYLDRSLNHYRKLVVKDGKLVGAILYGNVADGSWYFQLIQNQTKITDILDQLIFGEAYCGAKVA